MTAKKHKSLRLSQHNIAWLERAAARRGCSEADVVAELIERHRKGTVPHMVKEILKIVSEQAGKQ